MKDSRRGEVPSPKAQDGQQAVRDAATTSTLPATSAETAQREATPLCIEN